MCAASGDSIKLAEIILEASKDEDDALHRGDNARQYYEKHFNKQVLLDQLEDIMKNMIVKREI